MNVETVSYISSSGIVLSFLFGLLAFKLVLQEGSGIKEYALVSVFLSLSVLSHETGSLFIPLILAFKFLYNQKHLLPYLGSSAVAAAVYALFRFGVGHVYFPEVHQSPIMTMSLIERLLHIPKILITYLGTFLFPLHLSFSQVWTIPEIGFSNFYIPLMILLILLAGSIIFTYHLYKSKSGEFILFIFFATWLLIGLILFIQIIPAEQTVSERWFYFPMIGFLGLLGVLAQYFIEKRNGVVINYLAITVSIIIVLLSVRTIVRNNDWSDEFTLAKHDIKHDPNNYILANALGAEYLRRGDANNAIGFLEKSSSHFTDAQTLSNLGAAYLLVGDNARSKEALQKSINVNETSEAVINMAWLLATKGDPTEGETFIESRLGKYQGLWKIWMDLAIVKYKLGKNEEALRAAQKAYTMSQNEQTVYLYNQISKGLPLKVD
jgi:Tfp pilus assembly protein PilF